MTQKLCALSAQEKIAIQSFNQMRKDMFLLIAMALLLLANVQGLSLQESSEAHQSYSVVYNWTQPIGGNGGTYFQTIPPLDYKEEGTLYSVEAYCDSDLRGLKFHFKKPSSNVIKSSSLFGSASGTRRMMTLQSGETFHYFQIYLHKTHNWIVGLKVKTYRNRYLFCGSYIDSNSRYAGTAAFNTYERIVGVKGRVADRFDNLAFLKAYSVQITYSWSKYLGGQGGFPFQYKLQDQEDKKYSNLHAIEAYCSENVNSLKFFFKNPITNQIKVTPKFGGDQGTLRTFVVQPGDRVTAVEFYQNRDRHWIAGIVVKTFLNQRFYCGNTKFSDTHSRYLGTIPFGSNKIIGVGGRKAALIDGLTFWTSITKTK